MNMHQLKREVLRLSNELIDEASLISDADARTRLIAIGKSIQKIMGNEPEPGAKVRLRKPE